VTGYRDRSHTTCRFHALPKCCHNYVTYPYGHLFTPPELR